MFPSKSILIAAEIVGQIADTVTEVFKPPASSEGGDEITGAFISPAKVFGKVKSVFRKEPSNVVTTTTQGGLREHGNFDFFGRDALRKIGGLASRTGKRLGQLVASTVSGGLDVKNGTTFFGGAVESFKEHVRAIYPG